MIEDQITVAARWLAEHPNAEQPLTRTLREKFGLTFVQAVKAIAESRRIGGQK